MPASTSVGRAGIEPASWPSESHILSTRRPPSKVAPPGVEPGRTRHRNLRPACLPVPPRGRYRGRESNPHAYALDSESSVSTVPPPRHFRNVLGGGVEPPRFRTGPSIQRVCQFHHPSLVRGTGIEPILRQSRRIYSPLSPPGDFPRRRLCAWASISFSEAHHDFLFVRVLAILLCVLRLWQLAHTTSHFPTSFIIFWSPNPLLIASDTLNSFRPFTWSNSKTTGSSSSQSEQPLNLRYNEIFSWMRFLRAILRPLIRDLALGSNRDHLSLSYCLLHSLHQCESPSFRALLDLKSFFDFSLRHDGHVFILGVYQGIPQTTRRTSVGVVGIEPTASCSQNRRRTLRLHPVRTAPRIRTWNLLIRSQVLCPVELAPHLSGASVLAPARAATLARRLAGRRS